MQETYARWYAMSRQQQEAIESPGAWLTTVASRICLDLLGSARARRETLRGRMDPRAAARTHGVDHRAAGRRRVDPADRVTLDESVNMAFLVVLESMTPAERVAFILHDVFRYPVRRGRRDRRPHAGGLPPAGLLGPPPHPRRRRRPATPTARQAGIVRDFKQAWEAKDIDALIGLLDPDATAIADGGGLASAVLAPDRRRRADRALPASSSPAGRRDLTFLERTVNGQPGLVAQQDGVTVTVFAFDVAGDRIKHIWAVRNPEKLRPWPADG